MRARVDVALVKKRGTILLFTSAIEVSQLLAVPWVTLEPLGRLKVTVCTAESVRNTDCWEVRGGV